MADPRLPRLDAEALGQLALMQSVLVNLPDEASMIDFICRGLRDMPGVADVVYRERPSERESEQVRSIPVGTKEGIWGVLVFGISNPEEFRPYEPYLENLCFMFAVILHERFQRRQNEQHQAVLEQRVHERTLELELEVMQRKKVQAYLQESEKRYRTLVEHAPDAIVVLDLSESRVIEANESALRLFGCERKELLGARFDRFYPFPLPGGSKVLERDIKRADGRKITCEVRVVTLPASEGKQLRISLVDITERKAFERKLLLSDRIFDLSLDLLSVIDCDGKIQVVNPAWTRTLGWATEELSAVPFLELVHPDDRALTVFAFQKLLSGNEVYRFENRYLCKDGSFRWLSWNSVPFREEGIIISVARDVTARKAEMVELLQAKDLAEKASVAKSRFLDIAAHELRTPVTSLSMLLQLTQKQMEQGVPVAAEVLLRLRAQARRLSDLVVDLLDVSRLERGVPVIRASPTDIRSVVSEAVEQFRQLSPRRRITLVGPGEPVVLSIDATRISQVLGNLIDNALKYSPEDAAVEVVVDARPEAVRISVNDHGGGIPQDQQGSLFTAFTRVESKYLRQAEGIGLGLYLSKKLVELHGGSIGVNSAEGSGSTFFFEIPKSAKRRKTA